MSRRFPLGVVAIVFAPLELPEAASEAKRLGFEHIDASAEGVSGAVGPRGEVMDRQGTPVLPLGDVIVPRPAPGCSVPAPPAGEGMWERAVRAYRRCPGVRMEPWPGSVCDSFDAIMAMIEEVPGLRLLLDVGHVANWGGDPLELLPWADHVQLRQAAAGDPQRHIEEGGDVDFAAVLAKLSALDYSGRLSVEYFDLPELGWPLADPIGHSLALATHVRSLQDGGTRPRQTR